MENVKYAVKGGKLHIEIDLAHARTEMTKSGGHMCATSNNWAKFPELPGYSFNMVLVKKAGTPIPADSPDETMAEIPDKAMKMA